MWTTNYAGELAKGTENKQEALVSLGSGEQQFPRKLLSIMLNAVRKVRRDEGQRSPSMCGCRHSLGLAILVSNEP